MSNRWCPREVRLLREMRAALSKELADCPQFPEVVGDRRLLRFLRGYLHDFEKAKQSFKKFLNFRIEHNVNKIRQDIVYGGMNCPMKFPKGEIILKLIPQIVILPYAVDEFDQPVCVEYFNFRPAEVFSVISFEDYFLFLIYSMEYRALILEQLAEHRERELLRKYNNNPPLVPQSNCKKSEVGYGIIIRTCIIRDLRGLGFDCMSSTSQKLIRSVVGVVSSNYPEFVGNAHIINVPYVFTVAWAFVRTMLEPTSIKKVQIYDYDYLRSSNNIFLHVHRENLPRSLGGAYEIGKANSVEFNFDKERGGSLWYRGAPVGRRESSLEITSIPRTLPLDSVYSPISRLTGNSSGLGTPMGDIIHQCASMDLNDHAYHGVLDTSDEDGDYEPPHPNRRNSLHEMHADHLHDMMAQVLPPSSDAHVYVFDDSDCVSDSTEDSEENRYQEELIFSNQRRNSWASVNNSSSDLKEKHPSSDAHSGKTKKKRTNSQNNWHHWHEQPVSSKISLLYRRGVYRFVEVYVDPIVYYVMKYKVFATLYLLVILTVVYSIRFVIPYIVFPCIIYCLCALIL